MKKPSVIKIWRSIMVLPFNATVVIPALILYLSSSWPGAGNIHGLTESILIIPGLVLILTGFRLLYKTITWFVKEGYGTLAPWDPPRRLVIRGPYRYVRNPMISGVICVLLGEAFLFRSMYIMLWALIFFVANHLYFVLREEPELIGRYKEEYRSYKAHVPRWIPLLKPWRNNQSMLT